VVQAVELGDDALERRVVRGGGVERREVVARADEVAGARDEGALGVGVDVARDIDRLRTPPGVLRAPAEPWLATVSWLPARRVNARAMPRTETAAVIASSVMT
jgi:hypothetical protein